MKALVVTIWVFINLIFFGMCGYMYLLWSQYWFYLEKEGESTPSTYDQQIYFYNRGYSPNDVNRTNTNGDYKESKSRTKHSAKDNLTIKIIKNQRPRFPNLEITNFELDTNKYKCLYDDSKEECASKTSDYKEKLLKELWRVLDDESNTFKAGSENPYNVHYDVVRKNFVDKSPKEVSCEFKKVFVSTLKRQQIPADSPLRQYIPRKGIFENRHFNSCAIVASSGALKNSNLGELIDSHDLVLRFNHAPTKGYEKDVGNKTTIRVLNSQVVSKEEFKFLKSNIYRNITLVAWDPMNYTSEIEDWLEKPEFNLFPNYIEFRKKFPKSRFFLINPRSLWNLWEFLQSNSLSRLRKNPPSSGFLGLGLLLQLCDFVDMFEYVPSARATKKCHYYDVEDNPACTFGVWHPLAAEKLITYYMNNMDEETVFQRGFIRIPSFRNILC